MPWKGSLDQQQRTRNAPVVSYHITGNNSTDCKEQVGKYFEMCIEEVSEGNHPQLRRSLEESPFLRLQGTKDRVADQGNYLQGIYSR